MKLLFKNLKWMQAENPRLADVRIFEGKILDVGDNLSVQKDDRVVHLDNHFLYPGLINAHDHLEMNLYPRMGNPPYNNYKEWANEIYNPHESPVKEIESIQRVNRLLWGGIKNLVSGATTVVHHNAWHKSLANNFPVHVLKKISWAHSLAFEKNIRWKFPFLKKLPFVIHAAEGTDDFAKAEIGQLHKKKMLCSNTVLIHAVAADENEMNLIRETNASVGWCPSSNYFMFNKTAKIADMKTKGIRLMLGSDSTMTGLPTFLDELKVAKNTGQLNEIQIFDMITQTPVDVFNLPRQEISSGFPADLLIAPIKNQNYYQNLFHINSEDISAVIVSGKINYASRSLANELKLDGFEQNVNGIAKYFAVDVSRLKENLLSSGIKKSILESNGLWQMLG